MYGPGTEAFIKDTHCHCLRTLTLNLIFLKLFYKVEPSRTKDSIDRFGVNFHAFLEWTILYSSTDVFFSIWIAKKKKKNVGFKPEIFCLKSIPYNFIIFPLYSLGYKNDKKISNIVNFKILVLFFVTKNWILRLTGYSGRFQLLHIPIRKANSGPFFNQLKNYIYLRLQHMLFHLQKTPFLLLYNCTQKKETIEKSWSLMHFI